MCLVLENNVFKNLIFRSIGVCCPDDVTSEKIINLPAEQNPIWKDPSDLDVAESNLDNVAVRRPEERGSVSKSVSQ